VRRICVIIIISKLNHLMKRPRFNFIANIQKELRRHAFEQTSCNFLTISFNNYVYILSSAFSREFFNESVETFAGELSEYSSIREFRSADLLPRWNSLTAASSNRKNTRKLRRFRIQETDQLPSVTLALLPRRVKL